MEQLHGMLQVISQRLESLTPSAATAAATTTDHWGTPLEWAYSYLQTHPITTVSFNTFLYEFKHVFHLLVQHEETSRQLLSLRQGRTLVAQHTIRFRVVAAKTDWDESALRGTFHNSLSETIKDQLAMWDEPKSLDELINLAIKIDKRMRDIHRQGKPQVPCVPVTYLSRDFRNK